jgi:hypothetical protein
MIGLAEALELTRTGDLWLFRGRSGADRAIRGITNAPVNHVGMAIVVDDLPPLIWHAELGRGLLDVWSGTHQRGVQLHELAPAVAQWRERYHQQAWLRQLTPEVGREQEDAALRTVARLDGTPFPSTLRLAGRWLRGRAPLVQDAAWQTVEQLKQVSRESDALVDRFLDTAREARLGAVHRARELLGRPVQEDLPRPGAAPAAGEPEPSTLETAYCAEVVALTYEEMGLLPTDRGANWYDPGRFWSGDDLRLTPPFALGREIAVAESSS